MELLGTNNLSWINEMNEKIAIDKIITAIKPNKPNKIDFSALN